MSRPWLKFDELLPASARARRGPESLPKTIYEHEGRNNWLFRLACGDRSRGLEEDEILSRLHPVNGARCVPPLDDVELAAIAQSACRYEPGSLPSHSPPDRAVSHGSCPDCEGKDSRVRELEETLSAQAAVIRSPGLRPMEKLVAIGTINYCLSALSRGQADEEGFVKVSLAAIGESIGITPNPKTGRVSGSVGANLKHLTEPADGATPVIEKKLKNNPLAVIDDSTGEILRSDIRKEMWLRLPTPRVVESLRLVSKIERERKQRNSRPLPATCPYHPIAPVRRVCSVCGRPVGRDAPKHQICVTAPPGAAPGKRSLQHIFGATEPLPSGVPPPFDPAINEEFE